MKNSQIKQIEKLLNGLLLERRFCGSIRNEIAVYKGHVGPTAPAIKKALLADKPVANDSTTGRLGATKQPRTGVSDYQIVIRSDSGLKSPSPGLTPNAL